MVSSEYGFKSILTVVTMPLICFFYTNNPFYSKRTYTFFGIDRLRQGGWEDAGNWDRENIFESLKMTFIDIDIVGYCLENCILKFVLCNRRKNMLTMFQILFAPNGMLLSTEQYGQIMMLWIVFRFNSLSLFFGVLIITNAIFTTSSVFILLYIAFEIGIEESLRIRCNQSDKGIRRLRISF